LRLVPAIAVMLLTILAVSMVAGPSVAKAPVFAQVGTFATYTAEGGFIAYFSGVSGNITYSVANVYDNGTMLLRIFENITAGTDLPPFITTLNITDSTQNPTTFPAVSTSNLSSLQVFFQNVSASFVGNETVSVPAGQFHTMEFTGQTNETTANFWFEGTTGLLIEENAGTSAIQLESSNLVTPFAPPDLVSTEVPYELVFVLAFAIGGAAFFYLRHHYTKAASKAAAGKNSVR
jgi:hypothetical protein